MKRIIVIGSGGAGKSTLSRRLGGKLNLPVHHLDIYYWQAGWQKAPAEKWEARLQEILKEDKWIMDGNFSSSMERRIEKADTVIFLDTSRLVCMYRIFKRTLQYRGRTRPDLAEGCPERFEWEFTKWVWTYPARARKFALERIKKAGNKKNIFILKNKKDTENFIANLKSLNVNEN